MIYTADNCVPDCTVVDADRNVAIDHVVSVDVRNKRIEITDMPPTCDKGGNLRTTTRQFEGVTVLRHPANWAPVGFTLTGLQP